MAFNTAIFYDIENLLKGYNFTQEIASNLSLSEIVEAIRATEKVGQVALQRAYANWSDPRLAIMRGEINELGIDPIQVFGFGRNPGKNAADIQLAIDAIDLAHSRPALEIFVIVSGDGAFAALAKKLHEYGKTVIGCAYRSAANRIFQAVCDHFVWIADPEAEAEMRPPAAESALAVSDPRNIRLVGKVRRIQSADPQEIVGKTREVLNWYAADPECANDLKTQGLLLSVVRESLAAVIEEFNPIRLGYPKLVEYLQFACKGTHLCVVRRADAQPVLMFRNRAPSGVERLPDLEARSVHSPEVYRSILSTGYPVLRLPDAGTLAAVAEWLARESPSSIDLGSMLERAATDLAGEVNSESVKLALLTFIGSGVFDRSPDGVPLAEQELTLTSRSSGPSSLLKAVHQAAQEKLAAALGEVDSRTLRELIPISEIPSA